MKFNYWFFRLITYLLVVASLFLIAGAAINCKASIEGVLLGGASFLGCIISLVLASFTVKKMDQAKESLR